MTTATPQEIRESKRIEEAMLAQIPHGANSAVVLTAVIALATSVCKTLGIPTSTFREVMADIETKSRD